MIYKGVHNTNVIAPQQSDLKTSDDNDDQV